LAQLGYKPDLAGNGVEALSALDKTGYDLIFMDVMMPEMDGLEATRNIRDRQKLGAHPHYQRPIIIVAMTAQAMQGDREKCLESGMDDYLSKPIRPKDLREILERWGGHATPKPPVAVDAPPISERAGDNPARPPVPAPTPEPVPAPAANPAPATPPEPPRGARGGPPPVEMDRLRDLTDGNQDSLRELVDLYYRQTSQQLLHLEAAVKNRSADEVRRVAHSCAGASATLGMTRLVPLLRALEKHGMSGNLGEAPQLFQLVVAEFKEIQLFLATQTGLDSVKAP
jgi:CheY-like chemotaxis protein/HPt (histidine-containing phosphotransfer) domain-containing protein